MSHTKIFTAFLFITAQNWKRPKGVSINKYINPGIPILCCPSTEIEKKEGTTDICNNMDESQRKSDTRSTCYGIPFLKKSGKCRPIYSDRKQIRARLEQGVDGGQPANRKEEISG